ncbi:hypothetical protein [Micromonospora tulbaghiae]|uniref:hypothetical protein n=1 Tax=Micromonospora tulbaghiae TaxID=479978 RepID=UPI003EBE8CF0
MSRRLLALHLSARGGPAFTASLTVITLLAWTGGNWLASRPYFDGPAARIPVVALAPLLAVLLIGPTLTGADEDLERSTPLPWRTWRAGHILLATLAIAAALSLTGLHKPHVFGAYALIRNTIGCVGLLTGAAALLGARLAWLPAFTYVTAVYAAAPRHGNTATGIWAWPVQPSTTATSWSVATGLFILGTVSHMTYGSRTS